jgi:hypothetical protein
MPAGDGLELICDLGLQWKMPFSHLAKFRFRENLTRQSQKQKSRYRAIDPLLCIFAKMNMFARLRDCSLLFLYQTAEILFSQYKISLFLIFNG